MNLKSWTAATLFCFVSTAAPAQVLDLSGPFRCMQGCAGGVIGGSASVAQNGWDMNLVNETGAPVHAWIDHPGHIWVGSWDMGAVYSADGVTIQFDNGTVWQRDLGQAIAVPPPPGPAPMPAPTPARRSPTGQRAAAPPERAAATERAAPVANAYDGTWSVVIATRSGGCDPEYRYGVQISNGNIFNGGNESVTIAGRVAPSGAVRVTVSAGGQQASGEGRMSPNSGSGVWQGTGSAGSCSGVWQAVRRG